MDLIFFGPCIAIGVFLGFIFCGTRSPMDGVLDEEMVWTYGLLYSLAASISRKYNRVENDCSHGHILSFYYMNFMIVPFL